MKKIFRSTTIGIVTGLVVFFIFSGIALASMRIEAEEMDLDGFYGIENRSGRSGGQIIKIDGGGNNASGTASTTFTGSSGSYKMHLSYCDEDDGSGRIEVRINGRLVKTFNLNNNVGWIWTEGIVSKGFRINTGDKIEIKGYRQAGEYARVDYIYIDSVSFSEQPNPMNSSNINLGNPINEYSKDEGWENTYCVQDNRICRPKPHYLQTYPGTRQMPQGYAGDYACTPTGFSIPGPIDGVPGDRCTSVQFATDNSGVYYVAEDSRLVLAPRLQLKGEVRTVEYYGAGSGASAYGKFKGKVSVRDLNNNNSLFKVDSLSVVTSQDGKLLGEHHCNNCSRAEVESELHAGISMILQLGDDELNESDGMNDSEIDEDVWGEDEDGWHFSFPIAVHVDLGDFNDQITGEFKAKFNGVSLDCRRSANASGARTCTDRLY